MAKADFVISLSSSVRVTWDVGFFHRTGTVIGTTKKWLRGIYLIIACDQTNTFYEVPIDEIQIMRDKEEE